VADGSVGVESALEPFWAEPDSTDLLDRELQAWNKKEEGTEFDEEDREHWRLARPHESIKWWKFLESTRGGMTGQWSFLPFGGSWADQPDWLIHDLSLIGEFNGVIKEQMKGSLPNDNYGADAR
jgi:hypothetical protein